jgi:predicted ArsR family transcriptional regulator
MDRDFATRVSGIGALAEPARRALYQYVVAQPHPVSRDQAAAATGVARHTVKFHLDKLVEEGLLAVEFRRLSGRDGPGAGRPSKLYHRVADEISVSLPERHYDLAGAILAAAVETAATGDEPVSAAVAREAYDAGRRLAEAAAPAEPHAEPAAEPSEAPDPLGQVVAVLAANGYEPRAEGDRVVMANCPFHALAQQHTELVCGLNHALVTGLTEALDRAELVATLDPEPGRCCVTLSRTPPGATTRS